MKYRFRSHYEHFLFLIFVCSCILMLISSLLFSARLITEPLISNFTARSQSDSILLSWKGHNPLKNNCILELTIQNGKNSESIILKENTYSYLYTSGTHGDLYKFNLVWKHADENLCEPQKAASLFLYDHQLPDLPIISIETANGTPIPYSYIDGPENTWGSTLTNNNYVPSKISITHHSKALFNGAANIRVRGNTSAYSAKKPYKIKLEKEADLLNRNNPIYADTEWILLKDNCDFKTEVGLNVSQLCGLEWQPVFMPVNLILNGNWQGSYLLIESVKPGKHRVNIDLDGFILENDAYWWNTNGGYFQTEYLDNRIGYTYRYPAAEELSSEKKLAIEDFILCYEHALFQGWWNYENFIDLDSFTGWLLMHDILGTYDAAGTNKYLYKQELNPENYFSSKMKLGPAWDFDGAFTTENRWSNIHDSDKIMYIPQLLKQPRFKETYQQKWNMLSSSIEHSIVDSLSDYLNQYGDALEQSWQLDRARWEYEETHVQDAFNFVNDWFSSRTIWLNETIGTW